jgi:hypothetical protein
LNKGVVWVEIISVFASKVDRLSSSITVIVEVHLSVGEKEEKRCKEERDPTRER